MNIIILGPQGSGKGTQAELLAKKYNLEHFDTGKSLRQVALLDTSLGKEIHEIIMVRKELVPSRILREILHLELNSLPREQGIVFDGIPRNAEQAEYFDAALQEFGRKVDKVFFIKLSEEEAIGRISKRWVCRKCKNNLIMGKDIHSEGEKCPQCGGEVVQREDDSPSGVRKRLAIFQEDTMPVIEKYKEKGLVVEISGAQPIEKVLADIEKNL
ncbi:MAG: nucleoside monophosphate kinase [Parcubacteria group bacterium]|jgi:adenylate kinase